MVRSASSQFVDPTEDRDNVTEVQLPPWDASRFRGRLAAARLPPNLSSKLEAGPFVSNAIAERIHVEALNDISGWGPSDHCRIRIEVTGPA